MFRPMAGASDDRSWRRDYLAELYGEKTRRSVKVTSLVIIVINTVFIGLDWWAFRAQFETFLYVRLALNGVAFLSYTPFFERRPVAAQYTGVLAVGAMLLTVVFGTGGPASPYYAGLVLAFVSLPVLGTVTAIQAALSVSVLFAAFMSYPAFVEQVGDLRSFVINTLFLAGAGLSSIVSCALLDRARFDDFKRRRELEEARDELAQLDQAKSRFTANVHHELRTPLTLLLAPLEGMLSGDFGSVAEEQRSYLKTMHVNGLRLLKLINNLLDLAKVESQQLELRRRACDLGRLLDDVVTSARPLAEQKRIELVGAGLEALPQIHADGDALEKVVTNLLGNALKFTEPDGRIEVRGEPLPEALGGVRLTVTDTGVGLAPDQLERIFDRFAQADGSTTRRHEGTGIGLSLAKELVEAHGGRIRAESEGLGRGTRMIVELPVGEADAEADEALVETREGGSAGLARSLGAVAAEMELEEDAGPNEGRLVEMARSVERWQEREKVEAEEAGDAVFFDDLTADEEAPEDERPEVLVVEDNPDMRRLLAFVVGREFRVRTARNGREGLEAVARQAPDLVLTDVMMPEMAGTELCRHLKEDPETASIPVVLVTSKAEREMKIEGLELGADDYVAKPFHPRELLARVRSLVRLRSLAKEVEQRSWALERMNVELQRALRELKEAEVQVLQSERLAAVGELAAGVAHEVNNPVNFALNALRALRDHVEVLAGVSQQLAALEPKDSEKLLVQVAEVAALQEELALDEVAGELRELVGIVSEGLERTQRLVGDLRDFAGNGRGEALDVNLRRCLESTLQLLRRAHQDAGVRVDSRLAPEPLLVRGDPGALNQVFLNLLKNSTEALEGRGGVIQIQARRDGEAIELRVCDDGPGIPDEARERLFDPFVTTKAAGKGSGLGLSICRRIVTEHGGTISVDSPPGGGASFTIRLPAAPME